MVSTFKVDSDSDDLHLKLGLKTPAAWQCFKHHQCPGLIFVRNPFLPGYQKFWVKQCLEEYTKKPNKTNLDQSLPSDGFDNAFGNKEFTKKLRWVTLGYQYDWTEKLYYADQHVPFPLDLAALTKYLAKKLGFANFEPEAGIVNFYHMDSTLGGHTDHSEYDMNAPLFSISFGQTGVFLLGGPTKSTKPVAMFVNSGDVIVMSGPARRAYHAVPRIIPAGRDLLEESFTLPGRGERSNTNDGETDRPPKKIFKHAAEQSSTDFAQLKPISNVKTEAKEFFSEFDTGKQCNRKGTMPEEAELTYQQLTAKASSQTKNDIGNLTFDIHEEVDKLSKERSWQHFADYLKTSRINMNVRQVLPEGKTFANML